MEKINSTFWFANPYMDNNEKEQQATVVLEIDYTTDGVCNVWEYEALIYPLTLTLDTRTELT